MYQILTIAILGLVERDLDLESENYDFDLVPLPINWVTFGSL